MRGTKIAWIAGAMALATAWMAGPAKAEMTPDGLHTQPWFLQSFLDLKEDRQEAADKGKSFAIIWEQKGCPYCRETHLVNFAVPEIRDYVKKNFVVLQINMRGAREVTDFSGTVLSESAAARKFGVRFTPTVTFLGPGMKDDGKTARMTGYFRPFHFLMGFMYVHEKAYTKESFKSFIARKTAERKKAGKPVTFR